MPNNKNQHFVPQFLLKNFSEDKKSISMCLKDNGKAYPNVSIRDQCSKAYLYPSQEYEKALGEFEGECRIVIEKAVSGQFDRLSQKDYDLLKAFLLLQRIRTLHKARITKGGMEQIQKYLFSLGMNAELKKPFESYEITERNVILMLPPLLKAALEISFDLKCKIIVYEGRKSFITSDDPVIQYNPLLESHKVTNYGLSAIGIVLLLPFSPSHAIIVYDDAYYKIGTRKDSIVRISNSEDLEWINLLTALHADKAIYYLPGTHTQYDLKTILDRAKKTGQTEEMKMESYIAEDGQSELIHSFTNNYSVGASFSFLKTLDKARGLHFGNIFSCDDYSRPHCRLWSMQNKPGPSLPSMTFRPKNR